MRRRDFLRCVAGSAFLLPTTVSGQQRSIPVVGYLHSGSSVPLAAETNAFRQGLHEAGFVEGKNVAIEYRWAEGRSDALAGLAADLVRGGVSVIAAMGGDSTALAAKAATSIIPIVFQIGSDPISAGLVASLNHPGSNLTGISLFVGTLDPKRLELIHELVPNAREVAVLISQLVAESDVRVRDLGSAAQGLGLRLMPLTVANDDELNAAFDTMAQRKADALFVFGSPFFDSRPNEIVALSARHRIPATYAWREFVLAGGLMSYGTNLNNASRQTGMYVGRILNGENPADLPVQQPTTFQLVINLKAALALGITVPQSLLARANEVIE